MACIDRYIQRACLIGTIFVALSLAAIIFLSQSLHFLEMVLEAGAPTLLIWQLTLLALPRFLEAILPLSVMAACIFVYNRLSHDSELTVLQTSGISPLRIARPAIVLATGCVALMLVITSWAAPLANAQMKQIREQLKSKYSAMLLREGVFHKVDKNLTVYVEGRNAKGELEGIVIHDARKSADQERTIVARKGRRIRKADGRAAIVIQSGSRQHYNKGREMLEQLSFQRYNLYLPDSRDETQTHVSDADTKTLHELIASREERQEKDMQAPDKRTLSVELHRRIVSPFMALSFTLIGLCPFLLGPMARRGYGQRIMAAVGAVVVMQGLYLGAFYTAGDAEAGYYVIAIIAMYGIVFAPLIIAGLALLPRNGHLPHFYARKRKKRREMW